MHRTNASYISSLQLHEFRNYQSLMLEVDSPIIVLTGANGSGKTNLLEALSLLTPGRGIRRATFQDVGNIKSSGLWTISAKLECEGETHQLGTGLTATHFSDEPQQRQMRLNGAPLPRNGEIDELLSYLWLTPDHDALFRGPAGDRRRFLDRLTLALDPQHGTRVNNLDKLLRSRNKVLSEPRPDSLLLDALEQELSEVAISVATARLMQVESLNASITAHHNPSTPFPYAVLQLSGEIETWLAEGTSITAEDQYRSTLRQTRALDATAGRTTRGAHLSDLVVTHGPKNMPAERCSTGEQKALLIGLILAQAQHVGEMRGRLPILLLDEVAAHLDNLRRAALYDALEALGAQAWLTGTDRDMFAALEGRACFVEVTNGSASVRAKTQNFLPPEMMPKIAI